MSFLLPKMKGKSKGGRKTSAPTDWSVAKRDQWGAVLCGLWCFLRRPPGHMCGHHNVLQDDVCPAWAALMSDRAQHFNAFTDLLIDNTRSKKCQTKP